MAVNTVRKWFVRRRSGSFGLEDREQFGKPDDDQIKTPIQNNPDHMTRDITEILHIYHINIVKHLKTFGYVNRYYDI